jgi:hypothetical protein
MKKTLFYLFLALSLAQTLNAQVVNIPDANFKDALLQNPEINTNGDNEIQVSEAVAYSNAISVIQKNIKSLIGIEAFVNIKKLNCFQNQLTTLDVSKNIALKVLDCYQNQLIALDVSKNTNLINLRCYNNQIIALDVSKNIALTDLDCSENQLTALDVSKNTMLTSV